MIYYFFKETILIPIGLIFLFCCFFGCIYECYFLKKAETARTRIQITPDFSNQNRPELNLNQDENNTIADLFYVRQQNSDMLNYYEIISEENKHEHNKKDDLPSYEEVTKKV